MKKTVIVVHDPYDQSTWVQHETDDVRGFIKQQFPVWPQTGRIYHQQIAESNDVTPKNPADVIALKQMQGLFYVLAAPAGGIFNGLLKLVGSLTSKIFSFFMPKIPGPAAQGSPNNDLSDPTNKARLNGRIPDIFGTVSSIPDLAGAVYSTYNAAGQEIENLIACVGRGSFEIHSCTEGDTDAQQITGMDVSVYDPHTSIVGTPIYQVGEAFSEPPLHVKKSRSINGQTLDMPNDQKLESADIYFAYPNLIKSRIAADFTTHFAAGDNIAIYNAVFGLANINLSGSITINKPGIITFTRSNDVADPANWKGMQLTGALVDLGLAGYVDVSGQFDIATIAKEPVAGGWHYTVTLSYPERQNPNWTAVEAEYAISAGVVLTDNAQSISIDDSYVIDSVTADIITLNNPESINDDWVKLNSLPGQSTSALSATVRLDKLDSKWIGWYSIHMPQAQGLLFNFVFAEGLFWQSRSGRIDPQPIRIYIEYQSLDADGNPTGAIGNFEKYLFEKQINGFGLTVDINLPIIGSVRYRVCRLSPDGGDQQAHDKVKVRDVYAYAKSAKINYGNVTMLRARTVATDTALAVKERTLKLLVTRKLPANGTGALTATRSAADALIALAVDDKIGRMTLDDVDTAAIYQTVNDINTYFGTASASEFCYTFDSDNQSFQESAAIVASTVFSEAERYGSVLTLRLEKATSNSSLLFNHRNKVPKSEKRTEVYGVPNDYDGIELEYTDPADDSRIKFYIPADQSAKNPQKIETYGVRNHRQAHFLAWRAWNKLLYQAETASFNALRESDLAGRYERVLVADNTMPDTQDGEVISQDGLIIETSQACSFLPGKSYAIYLQLPDGSVDAIDITAGADEYHVVLQRAPLKPLVLNYDRWVRTLYTIIAEGEDLGTAFLLMKKSPAGRMINSVELMNYDDRYYSNDKDFINGLIS